MADQNEEKKDSNEHKEIDLKKILLPNTGPSVDSAQRVNAGALLAQEQNAALPRVAPAPTPIPEKKKDDSEVKSLETYRGDIESLVQEKNVSVVSIAAAEADKRQEPAPTKEPGRGWSKYFYIAGGVVLLLVVLGVGVYVAEQFSPVSVVPQNTQAPFINVDQIKVLSVTSNTRSGLMEELNTTRTSISIPLGLVEWLYLAVPSTDAQGNATQSELGIQDLLNSLAPEAPQSLIRTLQPTYLLGIHSYDENEAFLIMTTDSYETAYAGMLAWETTMQSDLAPLFTRTPPVHANNNSTQASTTSQQAASSTPNTTQTVLPGSFVDQVVDNHDARVVEDPQGDILLLWTFLDRNTIVITTNEDTLREIISRIATPAQTGLPQ